jgi:hypothetical protein
MTSAAKTAPITNTNLKEDSHQLVTDNDPRDQKYGWGTGASAVASGAEAFEVPPIEPIQTRMTSRFSRRERHQNDVELGLASGPMAGFSQTPAAVAEPETS